MAGWGYMTLMLLLALGIMATIGQSIGISTVEPAGRVAVGVFLCVAAVAGWYGLMYLRDVTADEIEALERKVPESEAPERAKPAWPDYGPRSTAVRRGLRLSAGLTWRWSDALWGARVAACAVPIFLAVGVVSGLVWRAAGGSSAGPGHDLLRGMELARWPAIVGVVLLAIVVAPLVEETLYRGLLGGALGRGAELIWGRPGAGRWRAVVVGACVFAAAHAGVVRLESMPSIVAVGLVCGWAMERRGGIAAPVVIHAGFNGYNLALFALS